MRVYEYVAGLEVAMHNALGVDVFKRGLELRVPDGELPFVSLAGLNVCERARFAVRSGDEIHDIIQKAALRIFAKVVNAQKVRVAKPRKRPSLGAEPVAERFHVTVIAGEHLDRIMYAKLDVFHFEDGAHPAGAELADYPAAADHVAEREVHFFDSSPGCSRGISGARTMRNV